MDNIKHQQLALIRGAGDLASAVALSLQQAGWQIIMTELEQPLCVRCQVSFSRAVYQGSCLLRGVEARRVDSLEQWRDLPPRCIGVSTLDYQWLRRQLRPQAVVDAIMAKRNLGLSINDAATVIALGPGFVAGQDCHAVIETQRGAQLGNIIWQGEATADTGCPGAIAGVTAARVLRTPTAGCFYGLRQIGDAVRCGDLVAQVEAADAGWARPVKAQTDGVLHGLLPSGTTVTMGLKCGDIDPRGQRELCFCISDKAARIGSSVEQALNTLRGEQ